MQTLGVRDPERWTLGAGACGKMWTIPGAGYSGMVCNWGVQDSGMVCNLEAEDSGMVCNQGVEHSGMVCKQEQVALASGAHLQDHPLHEAHVVEDRHDTAEEDDDGQNLPGKTAEAQVRAGTWKGTRQGPGDPWPPAPPTVWPLGPKRILH